MGYRKTIVDLVRAVGDSGDGGPDKKFVLVKDPNKLSFGFMRYRCRRLKMTMKVRPRWERGCRVRIEKRNIYPAARPSARGVHNRS